MNRVRLIVAVCFLCLVGVAGFLWPNDMAPQKTQEDDIWLEDSPGSALETTFQEENRQTDAAEMTAGADSLPEGGSGSKEETQDSVVTVYLCGAIAQPGVYEVEPGTRLVTAVEEAGGLTEEASMEAVNLAQVVEDGMQYYFPTKEEADSPSVSAKEDDGLVDLNSATKEDLMTLPGIGEAKAEKIIAYREEHGPFSSVEDLTQVPGIKEGILSSIREKIKVK